MNKNTVKAIQKRLDNKAWNFYEGCMDIGKSRYILHENNPEFKPYVLKYNVPDWGNPIHAGNVIDGIFIPADFPEKR